MDDQAHTTLLQYLLHANRTGANEVIDQWAQGKSYKQAVIELLDPTLTAFGEIWLKTDSLSLAHGYMAAKITEDILVKAAQESKSDSGPQPTKGTVVIGNIEDDFHALGRKMVGIFLRSANWEVIDLGNDVTAERFVNTAIENNARVIGASAMMYSTAANLKKVRQEIDHRGLSGRLQLAVGGATFKLRPELVDQVGGDGTASTAIQAPDLFQTLWQRSQEACGE